MEVIRVKLGGVKNVVLLSPEVQLLAAVKEESVMNIVRLYSNNTAGSAIDEEGNNLLHIAVKTGNIQVIQAVLMFYACQYSLFTVKNNHGQYPRDLTFSIEVLKCIDIVETASLKSCYFNDSDREKSVKADLDYSMNQNTIDGILREPYCAAFPILLSLDGGGVRGLVLIRSLMHLEQKLGSSLWRQIDWVCGTSTGAILGLALSRGHSLEHVMKLYLRLKNRVFVGPRPYNSRMLESFLKEELGTVPMSCVVKPKVIATCCLTHVAPPKLKLFRNYAPDKNGMRESERKDLGYDDPDAVQMWKAARCSSAAPTYFSPFEDIYSDGGIIANNPTLEMMTEFFRFQSIQKFKKKPAEERIGCVLSLGTGIAPIAKITINQTKMGHLIKTISKYGEYLKNMVTVFIKQMTASDGSVVDTSRSWCYSLGVPFFRFSPPLRHNVDLDETNDRVLVDLLWTTDYYMVTKGAAQVSEFLRLMRGLRNCQPVDDESTSSSSSLVEPTIGTPLKRHDKSAASGPPRKTPRDNVSIVDENENVFIAEETKEKKC